MQFKLEFRSTLRASRAEAWAWITSVRGISAELWPLLRMSAPKGVRRLNELAPELGRPLFRSRLYLFGLIPADYSDLTLLEMTEGEGFVEQSPMGSMRLWRHERRIEAGVQGCTLTDVLVFEPRFAARPSRWMVERLFRHRHAVLRRRFGSA